jgi:hypothetical protein
MYTRVPLVSVEDDRRRMQEEIDLLQRHDDVLLWRMQEIEAWRRWLMDDLQQQPHERREAQQTRAAQSNVNLQLVMVICVVVQIALSLVVLYRS